MAVEIASAWVRLQPSFEGLQGKIAKEIGGANVGSAGDAAGKQYSSRFGGSISKGSAALAGVIGGVVASVTSRAIAGIENLVGEAVKASDATQKFAQTLSFAGVDTKTIDALRKSTKAYADETVYDLSDIQGTTAQLAANGVKDYDKLTEAAGNLNAVAGGNADTFKSVGLVLTQTAGSGKLTTENWNQLADAIPGASGRLQEAMLTAGAYTGNFREAMEKGQITSEEFNAALLELGSEPVAVEAARSTETMEGAVGNLTASITGALADAFTIIKPAVTGFTNALAWFVSNNDILIPVISGLGAVLLAVLAPAIWGAVTATWAFTVALLANPITWVVIAIGLLVAAIVALAMNWDTVTAWLTDVWQGFVNWFTGIMDAFLGWWNGLWTSVWEWIVSVWTNITGFITRVWETIFLTFQVIGAAISAWWNGLWQGIWDFLSGIWNFIVAGVTAYFNLLFSVVMTVGTAISTWWNGLWQGVSNFFSGIWDGILNVFNGAKGVIEDIIGKVTGVVDGMKKKFEDAAKGIREAFDGIGKFIEDAFGPIMDFMGGVGKNIANFFGGMGDRARHVKGKLKTAAESGVGGGGPAYARVRASLPSGLRITDTLSNPARDRALGLVRSANSYHYDAKNPAVDIAGPIPLLHQYARQLMAMGGWRQFLWQVPGHYDHIHVAHTGGVVSSSWARMPGDRADERTVRLQVGETVLPRSFGSELENGIGGGPNVLVVVDADGQLIGRMRVEAQHEIGRGAAEDARASMRGFRGGF